MPTLTNRRVTRTEIAAALSGAFVDGPTRPQELVEAASTNGARAEVLEALELLPQRSFSELRQLWQFMETVPVSDRALLAGEVPATIGSQTPAGLDFWADKVKQSRSLAPPARWVWRRGRDTRHLYRLYRATPDWLKVWRHRKDGNQTFLPPLRLRHGVVLKHGAFDNPVGLLEEVFLDRWYECPAPPRDATMVDIGANIGAVSLYWAAMSPSLRIHSYEPNPAAVDTLRQNVDANGLRSRVDVYPEAVGPGDGELDLWVDIPTDLSTGYLDQSPLEGGRRIAVPMVGMDEVWRRLDGRDIWLLKVDTEGAEADILEGAPAALLSATQNAIVEYHDNICPGASVRCRQVLRAAGFQWQERVHPWDEGIIYAHRI